MTYISSIKTGILIFPMLALFITIPYMIWMYRRYGSINIIKTLIVYSFVLYLESCYLLVILPLPKIADVHTSYSQMINLIPFAFIGDFIRESPFNLFRLSTYIQTIKDPTFYVPMFNILMLIPFGMYLRYYFKFSLKRVIIFTALLSLFFELTQLSGLYFIYDSPYRICDIDDIIQNTTGGLLGYYIVGLFNSILPDRDNLDEVSLKKGESVSGLRRIFAFAIDVFVIGFIKSTIAIFIPFSFIIVTLLYFTFMPIKNGRTIGSRILNFHFEMENKNKRNLFLRSLGIVVYFYAFPRFLNFIMDLINGRADNMLLISIFFSAFMLFIIYLLLNIILILSNRKFPFDKIGRVSYYSDIKK